MTSKEIAIEMGLTPQTVDTYVKAAMSRLGTLNRREAARLLAAAEVSQQLGSPSPPVVAPALNRQHTDAVIGRGWGDWVTPPPLGGRPNTLTLSNRTFAVLRVGLIGAVTVLALALVIAGALRTFQ